MSKTKVDVLADLEAAALALVECGDRSNPAMPELVDARSEFKSLREWIANKSAPVLPEEFMAMEANTERLVAAIDAFSTQYRLRAAIEAKP